MSNVLVRLDCPNGDSAFIKPDAVIALLASAVRANQSSVYLAGGSIIAVVGNPKVVTGQLGIDVLLGD